MVRTNKGDYPTLRYKTGPHGGADLEELTLDGKMPPRVSKIEISSSVHDAVEVTLTHRAVVMDLEVKPGKMDTVLMLEGQHVETLPSEDPDGEPEKHWVKDWMMQEFSGGTLPDALRKMADRIERQGQPVSDEQTH